MSIVTDFVRLDKEYAELLRTVKNTADFKTPLPTVVSGLCEGASDSVFASLIKDLRQEREEPVLLILPDEKNCVRITSFLKKQGLQACFFVARDLTFYNITASHDYEHERLNVLSGILDRRFDAVVTTPDAALSLTIPPSVLAKFKTSFEYAQPEIDVKELALRLIGLGYVKVELVDAPGQFASRGDIFDIYPPVAEYTDIDGNKSYDKAPFRIELFGDEIDRLETFDIETQRITSTLDRVDFSPAREILLDDESKKTLISAISSQQKKTKNEKSYLHLNMLVINK